MSARFYNHPEEIIAFGMNCSWWNSLANAKLSNGRYYCPKCGDALFQMESTIWWSNIYRIAESYSPKYRDFIEWLRGRCFESIGIAEKAFERGVV